MESVMLTTKTVIHRVLFWFTATMLIAMAGLVIYQVFTRYVLDNPASFTEELVRYTLMWTAFAGGAYAFVDRKHMALVFFRDRVPTAPRRWLMVAIDVLILLFALVVLLIGGMQLSLFSWDARSALLGIPRGIVYLGAPLAGLLITVTQIINIWEDLTGTQLPSQELDDEELEPIAAAALDPSADGVDDTADSTEDAADGADAPRDGTDGPVGGTVR